MRKQKFALANLGNKLTASEMKDLTGGLAMVEGGGGQCIRCDDNRGYSSCWYTNGGGAELCDRVYPNSGGVYYTVSCDGCTMNS